MKRVISAFLALIMLFSVISSSVLTRAEDAATISQKLAQVQTKSGFIPGKRAAVVGNCYGFISAVCKELYGYAYQEGLASYTCSHSTGLYYQVAAITTKKTTDYDNIFGIVSFFRNNAQCGDIVHYASLSNSSSKHTFMVQSIDNEKMVIFHANYGSDNCQTDTIYWESFLRSPTQNSTWNGKSSRNTILTSKMTYGGMGVSINRRVGVTAASSPSIETSVTAAVEKEDAPENLELSMVNPYSVMVEWEEKETAESYILKYKKKGGAWTTVKAIEETAYRVRKLTPGKKYYFKVCSVNENAEKSKYTASESMKLLPPTPQIQSVKQAKKGLTVTFSPVEYCSGYAVFRATRKNGIYKKIAVLQNSDTTTYTDKRAKSGKTYYYKVWSYVVSGKKVYRSAQSDYVKKKCK